MITCIRMTALCVVILSIGCSPTAPQAAAKKNAGITTDSQEAKDRLAKADAVDGKSDHKICKCYVCGLGMNGSEEHSVKINDYDAHFCSDICQKEFQGDAEKIVLSTSIPENE